MTFLKRILLVDHEPRVTALVKKALEESGKFLIREEPNSRQTVNAARWFQPDLILFDVRASSSSVREIAKAIQADPSFTETPMVFLSPNAASDNSVVSAGILSGYSFMANPLPIEKFVAYVSDLLKLPADLQEVAEN